MKDNINSLLKEARDTVSKYCVNNCRAICCKKIVPLDSSEEI